MSNLVSHAKTAFGQMLEASCWFGDQTEVYVPICQNLGFLVNNALPYRTYYYDVLLCNGRKLSKDVVPQADVEDPKRPAWVTKSPFSSDKHAAHSSMAVSRLLPVSIDMTPD